METVASGTVGKALKTLDLVASFERPVRFSELLGKSDFPKATLYRILKHLTAERMLSLDPDRQTYSLGVRLVRLAHAAWTQSSLAPTARPFLDQLSASIGETIHLAQLDHAHVLYVDKRNAKQPIQMFSQAGKVGPAYCTGVGKAMMAFLPNGELERILPQQSYHRFTKNTYGSKEELYAEIEKIRVRGFAFDREEHEPNIICVAVPIRTRLNRVLGAISVTSSTERTTLREMTKLVPEMQNTARSIAEEAELWHFPINENMTELAEI